MLKGKINLTLMIGPMVPLPVPRAVMDALTDVTVTSTTGGPSGFQLTFNISNQSPLHTLFLLSGGASPLPIVRVVIIATVNGMPEVLMDGMMLEHRITPGAQPGQSTLSVMGEDLSAAMKCIDFSGIPYPGMPAEAQVAACLVKYLAFGIVPIIIPSPLIDVTIPIQRIPRHQGTDFDHIKMLADEIGYTFYVSPGPVPGTSIAYWGPEIKIGLPQSALNINMGPLDNVEKLDFNYNSDQVEMPLVHIHNPETKVPIIIPIPSINPFNPPLGLVPPIPKRFPRSDVTGKYSAIRAVMLGMARASQSGDVVQATGSLDVVRYGKVLKSRGLVGVRGAGLAFDGMYFVKEVTHNIKRGEYKQSFKLTRNALVSITPKVVP